MRLTVSLAAIVAGCVLVLAQDKPRSVWDGVYSKEQAARGEVLYKQHCAACHGGGLEGIEMAPALTGPDFLDKWAGQTVGDLFERIRTTMPADQPGKVSRDANVDISAYLLQMNRFAAGAVELPRETPAMKQIRIDAVKPQ